MKTPVMKRFVLLPLIILFSILLAASVSAAPSSSKVIHHHSVHYSAFNSSFIEPKIAASYSIVRAKNRGLVNIAAVPVGAEQGGGRSALVKGTASNILGQQQTLKFIEIREGDVVYYLASFKFDNEDSLTFKISVKPDPNKPAGTFSFQNTFYYD